MNGVSVPFELRYFVGPQFVSFRVTVDLSTTSCGMYLRQARRRAFSVPSLTGFILLYPFIGDDWSYPSSLERQIYCAYISANHQNRAFTLFFPTERIIAPEPNVNGAEPSTKCHSLLGVYRTKSYHKHQCGVQRHDKLGKCKVACQISPAFIVFSLSLGVTNWGSQFLSLAHGDLLQGNRLVVQWPCLKKMLEQAGVFRGGIRMPRVDVETNGMAWHGMFPDASN